MTKSFFADEIIYQGFDAPSRDEADVFDLEVTVGEIPKELAGTLLRVEPDPQFDKGPIAVANLPVRIRSGMYSNWVPASKME